MASRPYRPSPRPTYDRPTLIREADVTRHVWGDGGAGEVADWIYASTDRLHCLVFGLAPGGRFEHSEEFRTLFGADELMLVLEGEMLLANPETGESVRVPEGEMAFFRAGTWHHAFALGDRPLRTIEFFAPPPSTGTSGAYARQHPYLERSAWRHGDDARLGAIPGPAPTAATLHRVEPRDLVWRIDAGVPFGVACSTEHLTAGILEAQPSCAGSPHAHGGDELLVVLDGELFVRAFDPEGGTEVFEARPGDGVYLPAGWEHDYRNVGRTTARAVVGIAPAYLP